MGNTSKFSFPLPGRRHKPTAPPPPAPGPLTKAQKILGTGNVGTDPASSKWAWDARSNSAISISVSETTASQTEGGNSGLGISHQGDVAGESVRRDVRWEDESEIIPRGASRQSNMAMGTMTHDVVTDASSLRRRQSNSTITSYYDKSKQPLSISQQTSNSAMAKGLPSKVNALLDMDGSMSAPKEKKKKSKLDFSALLSKSKSRKNVKPEPERVHVLGPDMMTKSPSVMSLSPDITPSAVMQRMERKLRSKPTMESLREREMPSLIEGQAVHQNSQQQQPHSPRRPTTGRHRPTKSTVDLYNLYDHYEQRSFADVLEPDAFDEMDPDFAPAPSPQVPTHPILPVGSSRNTFLTPFPQNSSRPPQPSKQALMTGVPDTILTAGMTSLSLTSPPADCASVSSRHTRTSKASKRTDHSLTDLDLQLNSMLSLSSDSEEDSYEPSSKSSLAVPGLSDGQTSPTSPRSAGSQLSVTSNPQETNRGKGPKRTSFATSPQFLPIPEGSAAANPPNIRARSSSLSPGSTVNTEVSLSLQQRFRPSLLPPSTSSPTTSKNMSYGSTMTVTTHEAKAISMVPKNMSHNHQVDGQLGFPTPPSHRAQQLSIASRASDQPTPPLSPSSVDFYLQSQHTSMSGLDNISICSGLSHNGSVAKGGRRSSTTSSVNDASNGRFMAVTRQEEMLLAALRLKRARMREDIIAEFEGDMDNERGEHQLNRHATNASSNSSSRMSRQSSASTMRTMETGNLSARPKQQPQAYLNAGSMEMLGEKEKAAARGQILMMMDRPGESPVWDTAEPTPDLNDFLDFDNHLDEFPVLSFSNPDRRGSRASSRASLRSTSEVASRSQGQRLSAMTPSNVYRRDSEPQAGSTGTSHRGSSAGKDAYADRIMEEDEAVGVPRPDSPITPMDFPVPMSMTRKKQVRLSAVGTYKPNVEAGWWDDSG
ncbi:hypothetical protein B0T19DRAFT_112491 [Cercophora scortea]|uniref:Uncharacterized protein n=1 Tax=Cercophora scortea TaxID=314031 RepID=A0AAE0MHI7_9PEZI|nr:hypothetical protein B0T19DRAFT_112491 [Cercophora scortea]